MEAFISVLMSVFNEDIYVINEAIRSIQTQSYQHFEIIIVNDNPRREDLPHVLSDIAKRDPRARIINNQTNIGLACSMNQAAKAAKGDYLARMDADDISNPQRFAKEVEELNKGKSELVCTGYQFIDEHGNIIEKARKKYTNKTMMEYLPYENTIHHPTVMIKKEAFWKVGGYRDFPCAQDYDLWLRLYDAGVSMTVLEEELLYYRIRTEGISQKNKFKQLETIWYIQKLFRERRHGGGQDSYSKQNYEQWLRRHHIYDRAYIEKAAVDKIIKDEIDNYRGKPEYRIQRSILMLRLFAVSPFYRRYFMMLIKNKICRKLQLT